MTTRRRIIAVSLSAIAFFVIVWRSAGNAAATENARDEVMKVEEERNQALQKNDVEALNRIYADDVVYSNATGALLTKAQHLADLKARTLNFKSFRHDDVQVQVHGETGIVTGISTSAVDFQGTVSSSPRRFLNIYVKQGGRWLCEAHFDTPVTKP
jgi:ketosteroid isomerase-like protein